MATSALKYCPFKDQRWQQKKIFRNSWTTINFYCITSYTIDLEIVSNLEDQIFHEMAWVTFLMATSCGKMMWNKEMNVNLTEDPTKEASGFNLPRKQRTWCTNGVTRKIYLVVADTRNKPHLTSSMTTPIESSSVDYSDSTFVTTRLNSSRMILICFC